MDHKCVFVSLYVCLCFFLHVCVCVCVCHKMSKQVVHVLVQAHCVVCQKLFFPLNL